MSDLKLSTADFIEEVGNDVEIDRLYILAGVERYSTKIHKISESVLDHIAIVAIISKALARRFNLSKEEEDRCISIALSHDLAESYVGDITLEAKKYIKDLNSVKEAEKLIVNEHFSFFYNEFIEYEEQETICSKIVKLADHMGVYFYALQEIESGNKRFEGEHLHNTAELIEKKLNEIERMIENV